MMNGDSGCCAIYVKEWNLSKNWKFNII
jgi:hypothetical protein